MVDVFAVPDFKTLLDDHLDKEFSAQSKNEKTQLQWTFEAVTPDAYFVNGVRVFYRAYAADKVVQIIEDSTKRCGVYAKNCDVFDYPMRDVKKGILVDGMTVLASLPTELPKPYPFVKGGRELLDDVLLKVRQEFTQSQPSIVKAWTDWATNEAPASDSVDEYLIRKPLHIPLGDILFSGVPIDVSPVAEWDNASIADNIQRMRTTDCVKWSRWGHKREDHCPEHFARVQIVDNTEGVPVLVNALPDKLQFFRQWKARKTRKDDENGEFKFVLCREDRHNINSVLKIEGQLIQLTNGGHRVYWKNKRKPEDFPVQGEDRSFHSLLDIGWFAYGRNGPPADGLGRIGVVMLTDSGGAPLQQPLPILPVPAPAETEVVVESQDEEMDVENNNVTALALDENTADVMNVIQCGTNANEEVTCALLLDAVAKKKDDIELPINKRTKRNLDHNWYASSSVGSNNVVIGKRRRQSTKKYDK